MSNYEELKDRAKIYAKSPHMPKDLQGQLASVLILLDLAEQMRIPFWQVIHGMMIFQGKLAPKAEFMIQKAVESGVLADTIHYERDEENKRVRCWATSRATGEKMLGSWVSIEMAKAEGWTRNSKYTKSPEMAMHMLDLRAATFFCRKHGLNPFGGLTAEEVEDTNEASGFKKADTGQPPTPITSPPVEEKASDKDAG